MWFLTIEATIKTPHCCHLAAKFWTWVKIMRFNEQKVFIANVDLNLIHFHESSFLLKVTQTDAFSRHVSCSTNYSWPNSAWKWGAPSEVDFYWIAKEQISFPRCSKSFANAGQHKVSGEWCGWWFELETKVHKVFTITEKGLLLF